MVLSDIPWENVIVLKAFHTLKNRVLEWNIFDLFPKIQFYDYTKAPTRHKLPENYHLTFSYSGAASFRSYCG